jgi:phosphoserine phosphatase
VNRLRRAGFMVGLVSDSYFVAAEIMRRRIFADFALAHTLQFDREVCTGELRLNAAFMPQPGEAGPAICKRHVVQRLRDDQSDPRIAEIWAVGDNLNDLGMLQTADRRFTIEPKSLQLVQLPDMTVLDSFEGLLRDDPLIQDEPAEACA